MKFLLLIYNDDSLLEALPAGEADAMMRDCFDHADELRERGSLRQSQQLEEPGTARTVRVRAGKVSVVDGPFAETKEMLGGFNLIEAADMDEAVRIAADFPWTKTGSVEIRPIRDMDAVRRRVGAANQPG
ncbi:MAG TPA: YciI family protein [Rhodanobacteraceae bacterium]|nr:YciI family protein [Rhodanobacteraceae bacterium]